MEEKNESRVEEFSAKCDGEYVGSAKAVENKFGGLSLALKLTKDVATDKTVWLNAKKGFKFTVEKQ